MRTRNLGGAGPQTLNSVVCERPRLGREPRRLLEGPSLPPQPPLHIASGANKVVLQFHLGQAAIARSPQAMAAHQFALRAFNGIAVFHALFQGVGLLLRSPVLQRGVMFSHQDRAVSLVFAQALSAQGALMTLSTELDAVVDFASGLLDQATALGAEFTSRASGLAVLQVDLKIGHPKAILLLRAGESRANEFPAFGLRLHQLVRRDVGAVNIEIGRAAVCTPVT